MNEQRSQAANQKLITQALGDFSFLLESDNNLLRAKSSMYLNNADEDEEEETSVQNLENLDEDFIELFSLIEED